MKIHRAGRTASKWKHADQKDLTEFCKDWTPNKLMHFDGTIDKTGTRHTDLGISFSEGDVLNLHSALLLHYQNCRDERNQLQKSIEQMQAAFSKIESLIAAEGENRKKSEMLEAIDEIATHFSYFHTLKKPYIPTKKWVKWDEL